jgi:hypothetical protein
MVMSALTPLNDRNMAARTVTVSLLAYLNRVYGTVEGA